jgi:hypothetical protein
VLPIAPSTYFRSRAQQQDATKRAARAKRDDELRVLIQRVHDEHVGVSGPRKPDLKARHGLRGKSHLFGEIGLAQWPRVGQHRQKNRGQVERLVHGPATREMLDQRTQLPREKKELVPPEKVDRLFTRQVPQIADRRNARS